MKNKNSKKITLTCPNCKSPNIEFHKKLANKETEEEEYTYVKIKPNTYECKCQECGYEYEIDCGYEKQYTFKNSSPCIYFNNANILSIYMSDSPLEKNYKIVSLEHIKDQKEKEYIYLLLVEGEDVPILLSEDSVREMMEESEKTNVLIKKIYQKNREIPK